MKRVAIFVDGSNLFYTQKKMGWKMDVEKLLTYCRSFGEIVEATYYIGESSNESQKKYLDVLAYSGYSLRTKPIKAVYDHETGQIVYKANLDVEMAIDIFNSVELYDQAILVSGDSDFERALFQLKSRGKEIKVISTRGIVASELVRVAGVNYIDLQTIRESLERKPEEEEF